MTADQCIDLIRGQLNRGVPVSGHMLKVVRATLRAHPYSSELHCLYGDLLQLRNEWSEKTRRKAILVYQKALELDPGSIEAWEEIGYCHDILEEYEPAQAAFQQAIHLGGSPDAYAGLARVVSQMGDRADALILLSPDECPFHASPEVIAMREEIQRGHWDPID